MGKASAAFNIIFGAKTDRLSKDLKGVQRQMTILQRNLGDIGRKMTVGVTAPLAAIGTSAFRTAAQFEESMAKVRAVSGATGQEFQQLEKLALDLGKSTVFTASDVAQLQESFARLGFSTDEILNATEATLNLAQASGTDLASAADVAGSTLRGFGLNASETNRVTDVMAKSFSETALDMDSFREAMKTVAPVAASAGLSIEDTTAMLGTLANSGIKGGQAGTALRRIISELGTTSGDVAGEIKSLASEGLDLADAKDEVGRNAQSALLILAKGTETTDKLGVSLRDAEGAAKGMADVMNDTAAGSMKRMQSAVEGAQIALGTALAPSVEAAAGAVGKLAEKFSDLSAGTQKGIASAGIFLASIGPVSSGLSGMVGGLKNVVKGMKALRLAIIANPIGALATALLAVGSAAIIFASNTDGMTEAQREQLKVTREQNLELAKQAGLLKQALNVKVNSASIKELQAALSAVNKELEQFSASALAQDIEIDLTAKPGQQIKLGDEFSKINPQSKATLQTDLQSQLSILTGQAVQKGLFGEEALAFIRAGLEGNLAKVVNEYRAGLLAKRDEIQAAVNELIAADAPTPEPVEAPTVVTTTESTPADFSTVKNDIDTALAALSEAENAAESAFTLTGNEVNRLQDLASAYNSAALAAAEYGDIQLAEELYTQAEAYQAQADAAEKSAKATADAADKQKEAIEKIAGDVQSLIQGIGSAFLQAQRNYNEGLNELQQAFNEQELTAEEFAAKQAQLEKQRKFERQQATFDIIQGYVAEAVAAMVAAAIKTAASTGAGALALAPILAASASSLVKSIFSGQVPAFAEGGAVTSPTLALLGDNPSGKEMVVPFEKLPQFLNMFQTKQAVDVQVQGVLQGRDIYLSAARSARNTQRNVAAFAF